MLEVYVETVVGGNYWGGYLAPTASFYFDPNSSALCKNIP